MTTITRRYIFILLSTALLLIFSSASYSSTLTDFAGKQQSIDQYAGNNKWLIVMLWASDCHVCNQEAHEYVTFHEKHKNIDARVLGISLDGKGKMAEAKSFLAKHKVSFPNLIDEPENIASMYKEFTGADWRGTPTFLVYAPSGELLGQQVGAVPTSILESFIARESASAAEKPGKN